MNRNKKITVVLAFGLVVLVLTTAWGALTGAVWPPTSYQEYSPAGSWTIAHWTHPIATFSPRDAVTGTSSGIGIGVTSDPTAGGLFPEATSNTPEFYTAIRTGPNTDHVKGVKYVVKDGVPRPTILGIVVNEYARALTAPDEIETSDVALSIYSGAADKDDDGLPDEGEEPLLVVPLPGSHMQRI